MFKISLLASSGIFIFASGLAWGATTFKDGVISSDKVIEKKATSEKSKSTQVVNDIPDWCAQLPSSDFALYACGIGIQVTLQWPGGGRLWTPSVNSLTPLTAKYRPEWMTFWMQLAQVMRKK